MIVRLRFMFRLRRSSTRAVFPCWNDIGCGVVDPIAAVLCFAIAGTRLRNSGTSFGCWFDNFPSLQMLLGPDVCAASPGKPAWEEKSSIVLVMTRCNEALRDERGRQCARSEEAHSLSLRHSGEFEQLLSPLCSSAL